MYEVKPFKIKLLATKKSKVAMVYNLNITWKLNQELHYELEPFMYTKNNPYSISQVVHQVFPKYTSSIKKYVHQKYV